MSREDTSKIIDAFIVEKGIISKKLDLENFISYEITKEFLLIFLKFLSQSDDLRFSILTDLFAADFPEKIDRFEVVYSLLSLKLNSRIILKLQVSESTLVPSITRLYKAACWYERESYDMFGIIFENSPDMRRILTDYGFIGHPLRKDFPLSGHVEVKYDESLERVINKPVELNQEFRVFDFRSPWQGPDYNLPGDEKASTKE